MNGGEGISDIEGKAATGSGERAGMPASFKFVSRVCENCGEKIFGDAPKGLCPACVLETGLGPVADDPVAGGVESGHPAGVLTDFGDYELLDEIGRGGQGVVYRARQKSLNRTVALKVIGLGQWATTTHVKRFRREAEAAANLDHPCIVPIYDVGEREGSCCFSMKFIDGGQLDEVTKRAPISIRNAAELIAKLARTVHYAHEHGILHRDIKPGNILLDAKGEPHLTDFGLARLLETNSTVTHTMDVLGTPSYMAPEQAVGNNAAVSRTTDVYELGAVFYRLLTGHPPFAGGTTYETIKLLLDTEPRQPRLLNPKISRELSTICLKCLEKDPKRRYSSALALAEDLEHWLRHEPIRAKRSGFVTRARKWVRRNPAIAALIASLVALAAAMGWNVWKSELISRPVTKGIAVLPLENLSEDKANAYFADGVQDELLSNLSKIGDLKVISRTSVMQYKSDIPRNLREIAQQLGVRNVVEGSVRRSGNHVRVSVQLIDAQTDRHLWVQNYDRTLVDSLALQGELASEIAAAVGSTLSPQEKVRVEAKPTNNSAAYDAYLRARAFPGGSHLEGGIQLFQEAVKLDPSFVLAWAYLSSAQSQSYWVGTDPSLERLAAAKDSLDRARALDPNLPEVHLALGNYLFHGPHDYTAALAEFQQAEQGLPNSADVIEAIAVLQRRLGHWDETIAEQRRLVELNPRDTHAYWHLATTYRMLRRFPEALATIDRVLAWAPTHNSGVISVKADVLLAMGDLQAMESLLANPGLDPISRATDALFQRRYAAAIEVLSNAMASDTDRDARNIEQLLLGLSQQRVGNIAAARGTYQDAVQDLKRQLEKAAPDAFETGLTHAFLGGAYAGLGEAAAAIAEGQKAMAIHPTSKDPVEGPVEEESMANIYALLGDADHAIPILKRLLQIPYLGAITPAALRLHPVWDQIRSDPRFQELAAEKKP